MTLRPKGSAVFLFFFCVLFHFLCQLLIVTTVNTCVVVTEYLRAHSLVCLSSTHEKKSQSDFTLSDVKLCSTHTHAHTYTGARSRRTHTRAYTCGLDVSGRSQE